MMITRLLNFDWKSIGIVKISCSRSGHRMRGFNLLYSTFITFLKFLDTVVWCTPNRYAMSWSIRLSRNFSSTMMSWSNSDRTLRGPVLRYFDTCAYNGHQYTTCRKASKKTNFTVIVLKGCLRKADMTLPQELVFHLKKLGFKVQSK